MAGRGGAGGAAGAMQGMGRRTPPGATAAPHAAPTAAGLPAAHTHSAHSAHAALATPAAAALVTAPPAAPFFVTTAATTAAGGGAAAAWAQAHRNASNDTSSRTPGTTATGAAHGSPQPLGPAPTGTSAPGGTATAGLPAPAAAPPLLTKKGRPSTGRPRGRPRKYPRPGDPILPGAPVLAPPPNKGRHPKVPARPKAGKAPAPPKRSAPAPPAARGGSAASAPSAAGGSMADAHAVNLTERSPMAGLYNLGNTCYANTVLQIFRHSPGVATAVSNVKTHMNAGRSPQNRRSFTAEIVESLSSVMDELREVTTTNVAKAEATQQWARPAPALLPAPPPPPHAHAGPVAPAPPASASSAPTSTTAVVPVVRRGRGRPRKIVPPPAPLAVPPPPPPPPPPAPPAAPHRRGSVSIVGGPATDDDEMVDVEADDEHLHHAPRHAAAAASAAPAAPPSTPVSVSAHALGMPRIRGSGTVSSGIRYSSVRPDHFIGSLRKSKTIFASNHQQDAQEFLKYLIGLLSMRDGSPSHRRGRAAHDGMTGVSVADLFEGVMVNTIRCVACGTESPTRETFCDITLPVKEDTPTTLAWALDHFTAVESLAGHNQYRCDVCERAVDAERSIRLAHLPRIFCFHLHRFTDQGTKLLSSLFAPSIMVFTPWCTTSCPERAQRYELFGLICHSGNSASSGHYIAYVRPSEAGGESSNDRLRWIRMDDSDVRYVSPHAVHQLLSGSASTSASTVYLMFYRALSD